MFRLFKTFSVLAHYYYHSHSIITLSDKYLLSLSAAIPICMKCSSYILVQCIAGNDKVMLCCFIG